MALTIASVTKDNVTVVTGTVASATGGTVTGQAIFTSAPGSHERYRIKVVRLLVYNSNPTAPTWDSILLTDVNSNRVWESIPTITTTAPFSDQTNLGDEFRDGLLITATITTTVNGAAFRLYLYHGL